MIIALKQSCPGPCHLERSTSNLVSLPNGCGHGRIVTPEEASMLSAPKWRSDAQQSKTGVLLLHISVEGKIQSGGSATVVDHSPCAELEESPNEKQDKFTNQGDQKGQKV